MTDRGNAKTAIPVRISARDVRFSANTSCASLMAIESGSVLSPLKSQPSREPTDSITSPGTAKAAVVAACTVTVYTADFDQPTPCAQHLFAFGGRNSALHGITSGAPITVSEGAISNTYHEGREGHDRVVLDMWPAWWCRGDNGGNDG